MTQELIDTLENFELFAPAFLIVKSKSGRPEKFHLNRAQEYANGRLDAQLEELGIVRALVLKGRQQGMSTLISGRYFHKVITRQGTNAYILTHEAEATKNLFNMTNRYYENLPPGLCPKASRASAKELRFTQFDSGYSVGTAGNKGAGRSQTIQLFHGSEVAYWPHADDHSKGVLQAIPNEEGTEIILESTANGIGNPFHSMWKAAISGKSEYQAIFVPWYWQQEYRKFIPDFMASEEEEELLDLHHKNGLSKEHLIWRRLKINELSNDANTGLLRFTSEYPFNAEEAFLNPVDNIFMNSQLVLKAMQTDLGAPFGKLIIGVDPAIGDTDRTAIIRRCGRKCYNLESFYNSNTMETVGRLRTIILKENPDKVYIDCIGIGAGIVDRLREMGHECVVGVNVARTANERELFKNQRAELWSIMRDWFGQELPVEVPESDELHSDLCSLGFKHTSSGQLQIEGKDKLKARGMPSPDTADALALTFYSGFYEVTDFISSGKHSNTEDGMFT